MMHRRALFVAAVAALAAAQQRGTQQQEQHPLLTTYECDASGSCTPDTSTRITLDANWRWLHQVGSDTNCYTGDQWDTSICNDPVSCAANCALEGADYPGVYGIDTSGDMVSFKLVTVGQYDTNIGARTFLMADDQNYKQFMLKNREFAFDVDVSTLPCGLNGALYLVDMDSDGGMARFPGDKAGAAYGTGYCDAQCPSDLKFIDGAANIIDWIPDPNGDPNSGLGEYGSCCTEVDLWEANSISTAVTPHMCTVNQQYQCNGTECGHGANRENGVCDPDGCDLNPWRAGNHQFYGPWGGGGGGGGGGLNCNLQPNTNNLGTILGQPSVQTDPTGCCALCNATAGCVGFTYVEASSNCFLKSALGNPIADPGATSGYVSAPLPPGSTLDTTQPFTVVTQFKTADGTDSGPLSEVSRYFIQNGVKIAHPASSNIPGTNYSSITDAYCKAKAAAYGDVDNFEAFGGLARLGEVMDGGLVLVLSEWVDYEVHMLWLDSAYPTNASIAQPGVSRGSCATSSGDPEQVIANSPDATVKFSKISTGPIGFAEARLARELAQKQE